MLRSKLSSGRSHLHHAIGAFEKTPVSRRAAEVVGSESESVSDACRDAAVEPAAFETIAAAVNRHAFHRESEGVRVAGARQREGMYAALRILPLLSSPGDRLTFQGLRQFET